MGRRASRVRVAAAAVILLISVALAALVAVAVTDPTTFWRVDGDAVAESLERAGDGFKALPPCDRRGEQRWRCAVESDPGSGMSDAYRVDVDGTCWRATRINERDATAPARLDGCLGPLDFLWP